MRYSSFAALCGVISVITAVNLSAAPANEKPQQHSTSVSYNSKIKLFEQRMDEFITQQMTGYNAVGFSIVVVENNKIIYEKGFGYADKDNNIPVESSTLFHIGSITKLFTGISIMQLAQKGLIDIDAPIQQYLPEFSIKYHVTTGQPITIRSIMAHQSGIFGDKLAGAINTDYPSEDFRDYPEYAQNEYAAYHPNYTTAYSNFSVSLLGLIVERVSGQKYEDYVDTHIIKPCSMEESGFDPKNENGQLLAKGYDAAGNPYPYYYIGCNPAGFLASSSSDMGNFIKMILNNGYFKKNCILFPATLNYMFHPQSRYLPMNLYSEYGSVYNFGLSWMLENRSFNYLGKVVGHGGNLPPYNSNLLIAKDRNIGIFVTANKEDFYPNEISYYALAQAGEIFRKIIKPELPAVPPVISLPEHLKKMYTGTYCILYENPVEVYPENDTLYIQFLHTQRIPLVYHADDWFSFSMDGTIVPDIRFAVRFIAGRKVLCMESRDSMLLHRMIFGSSFSPSDTISDEVRNLTGIYAETSSGAPALYLYTDTLSQNKKEFLTAYILTDNAPYIVKPAEDNTFIIQGLGRGGRETVYLKGDTLNYSGYKFVKFPEAQSTRQMTAFPVTEAETLKSPEEVINDLKKRIRKEKFLD